ECFLTGYGQLARTGLGRGPMRNLESRLTYSIAGIVDAIRAFAWRFQFRCRAPEAGNRPLPRLQRGTKSPPAAPPRLRASGPERLRSAAGIFPKSRDSRSRRGSVDPR